MGERPVQARASRPLQVLLAVAYVVYLISTFWLVASPRATESGWAVDKVTWLLWNRGYDFSRDRVEVGLNIVMFLPASLLGLLLWRRTTVSQWVLIGFVTSLSIELGQKLVLPYRVADATDVVANTLGILIGGVLGWPLQRLLCLLRL